MHIKRRLSATLFVLVTHSCISQNSAPNILTSAGDYQENAFGSLSWTVGEPLIETGCSQSSFLTQGFEQPQSISINDVTGTNSKCGIIVYPNPVTSMVYITSASKQPLWVELMDLNGQMVYKITVSDQDNKLDMQNLPNGIYLLRVYNNSDKRFLQTFKIDKIK